MKTISGVVFVLLFSGHGATGGLTQIGDGIRPEKNYLSTDKGHGGGGGFAAEGGSSSDGYVSANFANGGSSSGGYAGSNSGFEKG